MARVKTRYEDINFTYKKGDKQASDTLIAGGRFARLDLMLESGDITTTTGTLNPHHAGLANMIARFEVYDNNNRTYIDMDGASLYDQFGANKGVFGDNVALPGGANTTASMRSHLPIFLDLHDGHEPGDTLLQSVEKTLYVKVTYNNPQDAGVLFGDNTGLAVADGIQVYITTTQFRLRDMPGKPSDLRNATPFARSLRSLIQPVNQTNDKFKVELPKNEEYRGVYLVAEREVNGVWVPDSSVINLDKLMYVKSTKDKNVYQAIRGRLQRSITIQERENANLPDGVFDFNFLYDGRANGTLFSSEADELFIEVAAVKHASDECRIRVVVDTLTTQGNVR